MKRKFPVWKHNWIVTFCRVTLFSNLDLEKSKMSEHSVLVSRTSQSSDKFYLFFSDLLKIKNRIPDIAYNSQHP